jgi:ribosomal protein S18 acetylase RimI-like enzyme
MTFTVRLAVPSDADGAGRVHAQAWREAYRGILSDEWIAAVSDDERIARWEKILNEPNAATQWVAEDGGRIVGFAASGPARDEVSVRELELWSMYVLESHQRRGIATALADAAIGDHPASLWVVAQNTRAQAFYRRLGFEPDGAESVFEAWDVAELRMTR